MQPKPTPNLNTGPRRYCPHCRQQIATKRGGFINHQHKGRLCPGSGQRAALVNTLKAEQS